MTAALAKAAKKVLRENDRGDYSVPAAGLYPVQFNWDSAVAALGYRTLDADRAWRELESLLAAQREDGMAPHIVFRGECGGYFPGAEVWRAGGDPPTSGISQPPVATMAARRLFELHGAPAPESRLDDLLRRLEKWHAWFFRCRRDKNTDAALIVHPWESGRDNSPDWDAAMARVVPHAGLGDYRRADLNHVDAAQRPQRADYDRYLTLVRFGAELEWRQEELGERSPFRMLDPLMTAVLARAEKDLAHMAGVRGMPETAAAAERRCETWQNGMRALWCENLRAFAARSPETGEFADAPTAASLLSPLAGVVDDKTLPATLEHFDRMAAQTRFAVACSDPARREFDSRRYWRGPVWAVINRLVGWGLEDIGETGRAEKLRRDTAELAAMSGFCEYYEPNSGEGLGGQQFTWPAAIYLDWAGAQ